VIDKEKIQKFCGCGSICVELKAENRRLKQLLVLVKGRLVSVHLTSKYDFGKEIEMIETELK